MTTRAYDIKLKVANAANYSIGSIVYGTQTNSVGEVFEIENNILKLRLANPTSSFNVGEYLVTRQANLYTSNVFINQSANLATEVQSYALPVSNAQSDSIIAYFNDYPIDRTEYFVTANNLVFNRTIVVGSSNPLLNTG